MNLVFNIRRLLVIVFILLFCFVSTSRQEREYKASNFVIERISSNISINSSGSRGVVSKASDGIDGINLVKSKSLVKKSNAKPNASTSSRFNSSKSSKSSIKESKGVRSGSRIGSKGVLKDKLMRIGFEGAQLVLRDRALPSGVKIKIESILKRVEDGAKGGLAKLGVGMRNVTGGLVEGYRFLPHGTKFKEAVLVKLPYDPKSIPSGLTEEDIKTYYYDEVLRKWISLKRIGIDKENKLILSVTDHFTDMINSTLPSPGEANISTFDPTSIKGIGAGTPSEGISLIELPSGNNYGDVSFSYPLKLPKGRAGLSPMLSIDYSSDNANGLLGVGWLLRESAIVVDTRWGVPRYDKSSETETYLLNGSQLAPLAHRGQLEARKKDKRFYPRVEGGFSKIIRKGNLPSNYYWEITSKDGTKRYYGKEPSDSGSVGVLESKDMEIFKWFLRRVVDSKGNTIDYSYDKESYNIYLKKILYTGHNGVGGKYSVEFSYEGRPDRIVSFRSGFKILKDKRLSEIKVKYRDDLVRSYKFSYKEGAFSKSLLESISEGGASGATFHKHEFSYYDERKGGIFVDVEDWVGKGRKVSSNKLLGDKSNILGGSLGTNSGVHGYFGVAIGIVGFKEISGGYRGGYSSNDSETVADLFDINGDGLADMVYDSGGGFKYRLNEGSVKRRFGEEYNIGGSDFGISYSRSETTVHAGEAYLGFISLSGKKVTSKTKESKYLRDVNGDGLIDYISNGSVYFNTYKGNNSISFGTASANTLVPVGNGSNILTEGLFSNAQIKQFEDDYKRDIAQFPLIDAVRQWQVPFDGDIKIEGQLKILGQDDYPDTLKAGRQSYKDFAGKDKKDGVKASIQYNGVKANNVKWYKVLPHKEPSTTVSANVEKLSVREGDSIYFRLQSGQDATADGSYDQVEWSPKISYLDLPKDAKDLNNLNPYVYKSSDDFVLAGRSDTFVVPMSGDVKIKVGFAKKGKTSDDIRVDIEHVEREEIEEIKKVKSGKKEVNVKQRVYKEKGKTKLLSEDKSFSFTGSLSNELEVRVGRGDLLKFNIYVNSPIDLQQLEWKPLIEYKSVFAKEEGADGKGGKKIEEVEKPVADADKSSYTFLPMYNISLYPKTILEKTVIGQLELKSVKPMLSFKTKVSGYIWLKLESLKEVKTVKLKIEDGKITNNAGIGGVKDVLFARYVILDKTILDSILESKLECSYSASGVNTVLERVIAYNNPALPRSFVIEGSEDNPDDVALRFKFEVDQSKLRAIKPDAINKLDGEIYFTVKERVGLVKKVKVSIKDGAIVGLDEDGVSTNNPLSSFEGTYESKLKISELHGKDLYFSYSTTNPELLGYVFMGSVFLKYPIYRIKNPRYNPSSGSSSIPEYLYTNVRPAESDCKGSGPEPDPCSPISLNDADIERLNDVEIVGGKKKGELKYRNVPIVFYTSRYITEDKGTEAFYPESYRGWSYFAYKGYKASFKEGKDKAKAGNLSFEYSPNDRIDKEQIDKAPLSNADAKKLKNANDSEKEAARSRIVDNIVVYPMAPRSILLSANADRDGAKHAQDKLKGGGGYWLGNDKDVWISGNRMSSSRLGVKHVEKIKAESFAPGFTTGGQGISKAPILFSYTKQVSVNIGAGVSIGKFNLGANAAQSTGDGSTNIGFMDMNGDRFPDIVSSNKIQYTNMLGGLSDYNISGSFNVRESSFTSGSGGLGANLSNIPLKTESPAKDTSTSGDVGSVTNSSSPTMMASVGGAVGAGESETISYLIDINGDALPDKLFGKMVAFNNGRGFESQEKWTGLDSIAKTESKTKSLDANLGFSTTSASFSGGLGSNEEKSKTTFALIDMNGDGLIDKVRKSVDSIEIAYNTGYGFAAYQKVQSREVSNINDNSTYSKHLGVTLTIGIPIPIPFFPISIVINPGFDYGQSASSPNAVIKDINGDGYPDYVIPQGKQSLKVYPNKTGKTNLLHTIKRPLGAKIELFYEKTGNTFKMPYSKWVLSKTKLKDPIGYKSGGSQSTEYITEYEYSKPSYDRREREFFGFKSLKTKQIHKEKDANNATVTKTRSVIETFDTTNYYRKGLLLEQLIKGDGKKYFKLINTYDFVKVLANSSSYEQVTNQDIVNKIKFLSVFPRLLEVKSEFYEGQVKAQKTSVIKNEYDTYGNITKYIEGSDPTLTSDDVIAFIKYSNTIDYLSSKYIVNLPISIRVADGANKVYRERNVVYDSKGNLIKLTHILEDNEEIVYDMQYDKYGNMINTKYPQNHKGERYSVSLTYDTELNTYVTETKDAFGYSSKSEYDYKFGLPLEVSDLNDNVMRYSYDEFGRTTKIAGPYDSLSDPTIIFSYETRFKAEQNIYPHAITKHKDKKNDPIETVLFIDSLGRVIQTKKDATISTTNGTQDKMVVSGRVEYDFWGRVVREYYPGVDEKANKSKLYINPSNDMLYTEKRYDVMDRVLEISLPSPNKDRIIKFSYGFEKLKNKTYFLEAREDPLSNVTKTYKDIKGLIRFVKEPYDILTEYSYNPMKELILVKDHEGNLTKIEYDNLGRRIYLENGDIGFRVYEYDKASNLISQHTSELARKHKKRDTYRLPEISDKIEYIYEYNRLQEIKYPYFPANNVIYEYGDKDASYNRVGRVIKVLHQAGSDEYYYGKLGEVVKEVSAINAFIDETKNSKLNPLYGFAEYKWRVRWVLEFDVPDSYKLPIYVTEYTFDNWQRLKKIVLDSGGGKSEYNRGHNQEAIEYEYDSGGLVKSVRGRFLGKTNKYVEEIRYDKFGRKTYMKRGDGSISTYSYDRYHKKLSSLRTEDRKGFMFQNLKYKYDLVDNVIELKNSVARPDSLDTYTSPVTHNFTYDKLYRLTFARGTYSEYYNFPQEKVYTYKLGMYYDKIHNITSKEQNGWITKENILTRDRMRPRRGSRYRPRSGRLRTPTRPPPPPGTPKEETPPVENFKVTILDDMDSVQSSFRYTYDKKRPHAPIRNGKHSLEYDANGNLLYIKDKATDLRTHRVYVWDDENRLQFVRNRRASPQVYRYDHRGIRRFKADERGIGYIYVNQYLTLGRQDTKHIFVGNERIVSIVHTDAGEPHLDYHFYYHTNHLGSTNFVTLLSGERGSGKDLEYRLYEHIEYVPFGGIFIEKRAGNLLFMGVGRMPFYLFTGKEIDRETGLYYYGARYYDPKGSLWVSPDPIFEDYLPTGDKERDSNLPGMGGIYNSLNLNPYAYAHHNPLRYTDPSGEYVETAWDVTNVVMGIDSFFKNVKEGNYLSALVDLGGLTYDGAATLIPLLPAFAGVTIKASRSSAKALNNLRRKAVRQAWKQEVEAVKQGKIGIRKVWNKAEKAQLLKDGKVKGYEGHHINSVKNRPDLADNPDNIKFVKGRKEHLKEHGGNFRNKTEGKLINREKILKQRINKE